MTELGFLLDLLFEHDLSKDVQLLIKARVKEIETPQAMMSAPTQAIVQHGIPAQAASTLANLAKDVSPVPKIAISAEGRIKGGQIQTGDGIKGPRKW